MRSLYKKLLFTLISVPLFCYLFASSMKVADSIIGLVGMSGSAIALFMSLLTAALWFVSWVMDYMEEEKDCFMNKAIEWFEAD